VGARRDLASAPGIATGLLFGLAAIGLLQASLYMLIGVVLIQVLLSWFNPHVPIAPVLDALTRPFYAIFRRFIPRSATWISRRSSCWSWRKSR